MITVDIEKKLKAYHGQHVLKVVQGFPAGSITQVYGPSGVGKTTFLKILAGFIQPEKGSIIVDDVSWLDTATRTSLPPQKRMAGFVFQDYALFPNMTVQQHLEYATRDIVWIEKLLSVGKLETFAKHKPEYLSGGQQQRLAILRALSTKPKLLLMDEPFSALDPEMKSALIKELKVILDEIAATVLIVTHNPQELNGWANQKLIIS